MIPNTNAENTTDVDNVNHPQHYNAGKYETIDIIESICNSMPLTPFDGMLLGNIIKYISRFKHKNGTEDLRKAEYYLKALIKTQENQNT